MTVRLFGARRRAPAGTRRLADEEWVALHVPRFERIRPRYESYERFLAAVLREACRGIAPLAIVETRTKSLSSFAEKILRKRALYEDPRDAHPPDPLARMTDLCGGRVIVQTAEQVHAVCRFIERVFDIDWDNSEDVSARLRPAEFGYRSVHYIVRANRATMQSAGVSSSAPGGIRGLRAEIQVRTVLEHAWADMGHDMTYKTELRVPPRILRQFAAVAATLESADREFGRLAREIAGFKSNYGAYHSREDVEKEIGSLRALLSTEAGGPDLAARIARLALSIGEHRLALAVLRPHARAHHAGVERERGIALTELHRDRPRSRAYLAGRTSLEAACGHPSRDAETLCALAESWMRDDEDRARELFHEAIVLDATEPVTLARYLELEVARSGGDRVLRLAEPMIFGAMSRCRAQIEGRVNLPWAWASLALFHLFRGEPFEALDAIAHVVALCEPAQEAGRERRGGEAPHPPCAAGRALHRLRETLVRVRGVRSKLEGYDWCERAVLLGLGARLRDPGARRALKKLASSARLRPSVDTKEPVVILSGGCVDGLRKRTETLRPYLARATEGLAFTLLWGGTNDGMSGVAGYVARRSRGRIDAFAYVPMRTARRVFAPSGSMRRIRCRRSPGPGFTPLEPMQGWTDLVSAGIDPRRVKVLGYACGPISRFECALALALGARVGEIDDATLPRDRRFDDPSWSDQINFVRLPMDAMTLRAFLLVDGLPRRMDEFEMAARKAHEEYVRTAVPREPSLLPWRDLPEHLKISNFHQIAYAAHILGTAGLGVRPITDPKKPPLRMTRAIGAEGVRRLAEMEHGRWNVERLLLGWRYAAAKDVVGKRSPYLVPWRDVPARIRRYDLDAIRGMPERFREAGLEIFKL